ncbi:MAG: TrkH family potassium uptake protein [Bacteroidales bacterium]|nr:TrkH family potassium uptake protein [Bacteroidales bacterium]HHT03338.1 TrkH family potassium uptake protein [Bacteroidales bacterium]
MFKSRFVTACRVIGMLLMVEAGFMLSSFFVALFYNGNDIKALLISSIITFIVGFILRVPLLKSPIINIDRRLGFLVVALIWILMTIFGSLPYYIGGYLSYTDSFFETMSGFTTTGASVIADIESIPKGIVFWRSLTNWIGGIGIVVMVISFIPFIGAGAMSLFSAEVPGPSKDKLSPHIKKTGKILLSIYFSLTVLCIISLFFSGMDLFDAICHSFSTLASGGFSTKNASGAAFSPLTQYVLVAFMIPAGTNFTLIYYATKGEFKRVWLNEEFKAYILITISATSLITFLIYDPTLGLETSFRYALFQVSSLSTSTGFVNANYTDWALPAIFILYLLMFSGAMSGSTSGGLKIIRVLLLFKNAIHIIQHSNSPRGYLPVKFEKKVVPPNVMNNVMTIFFLYITTYVVGVLLLLLLGTEIVAAMGGAVSCMSNIGPGLGSCGGFGNYSGFSDATTWVLSALMYLGRLELITVFCLFMPAFWKR